MKKTKNKMEKKNMKKEKLFHQIYQNLSKFIWLESFLENKKKMLHHHYRRRLTNLCFFFNFT